MRQWLRLGVAILLSLFVVITGAAGVSHAEGGVERASISPTGEHFGAEAARR